VTIAYPASSNPLDIDGVYPPQHDSQLLIDSLEKTELAPGRRVLDFCTGSGVVAIAAAELGAASVVALDICPRAVHCSQGNAVYAGVDIDVREGSCSSALDYAPFDLIVSNPPYVPTPPAGDTDVIPITAGPARPGMRASTGGWCWIRCVSRRPDCWTPAARCCWCSRRCQGSRSR
jgi:release factor glutamine methyltransferase